MRASPQPATRSPLLLWGLGLAVLTVLVILAAQRASGPVASAGGVNAPRSMPTAGDISSMSPRERAGRLFDRIMRLSSEGKTDSVQFFAPMALAAFESLGELDSDLRFDLGRIAEVSGNLELAAAQADSILMAAPDHLLGLVLAARIAKSRGDEARYRALTQRLLAVQERELARDLPEYTMHRAEIDLALQQARSAR
ncbi:MAG TPA: hypothetical protein VNL96_06880 [Gemmatimonadaceae bacterium]|nr:hypothetical protein [Gemmatimonadaceae bacterium]